MRILITGAAGFLGRAVARQLGEAGHVLTLATHQRAMPPSFSTHDAFRGDIQDADLLADVLATERHDAVCHLAALTGVRDSENQAAGYFDVNLGGTISLLTAIQRLPAEQRPATVVLASTRAVYDADLPDSPVREDAATTRSNPYGLSKLLAERALSLHCAASGLSAWSLRCFNISGGLPGIVDPDTSRLIPRLLAAARGEMPPPPILAPNYAIDFSHVADVADAFRLALESEPQPGKHHSINIGSGVGTPIADVVGGLGKALGRDIPVIRPDDADQDSSGFVAEISTATKLLGWRPARGIAEILADATLAQEEPA
ncbi:UDP-glucose 4-epimerase [Actinoplanes tereljensis]|uniref:UDP-glucose 4-epimerase n=1 Tax=Paractinoplanes tereljensis TaxID=571912 RepID=A0A919NLX4_9ACTN|nr:NAD-dependent epimerase/dehydratase family protein [Actinoplanes tereljensis]GIF20237.1 UDP-glucose 4-epimerase GalE [Actinoplanes tereljensis]